MKPTRDVRVFSVQKRIGKTKPWTVRWRVAGVDRSKSFEHRKAAEPFRTKLAHAADSAEAFDQETCLPLSWSFNDESPPFVEFAADWFESKWLRWANTTRRDYAYALSLATMALIDKPGRKLLEADPALRNTVVVHLREDVFIHKPALTHPFLLAHSIPISEITVSDIERTLDHLSRRADGTLVVTSTMARRRGPLKRVIAAAVRKDFLISDPFAKVEPDTIRSIPGQTAVEVRTVLGPCACPKLGRVR